MSDMFHHHREIDEAAARLKNHRVDILGAFPYRDAMTKFIAAVIQTAGFHPVEPREDDAGNCVVCGEAGRCPGVHAFEIRI